MLAPAHFSNEYTVVVCETWVFLLSFYMALLSVVVWLAFSTFSYVLLH